jgi:hypothetical protein
MTNLLAGPVLGMATIAAAVVAGDPRARAARCSAGARRHEVLSAALIGLTVGINLLLVLYLAARLVG